MGNGVRRAADPSLVTSAGPGPSGLRQAILRGLRFDGPQTPDRLATSIGASRTGVLQQLRALEGAGLVRRQAERHGVGRPRHVYDVTPMAQDVFPSNYDGLATGLLAALESIGGVQTVDDVFAARRRGIAERVTTRLADRLPPDADLFDRVRELALVQDEQGYLADAVIVDDGTIRLREHNCAIYRVAVGQPAACAAELELFREVLDADVSRESHIASGDRCCSYKVTARIDA